MVGRTQVLSLYRSMLREARNIDNYNFRSHAVRKIMVEFRDNRALSGNNLEQKFSWGGEQLEILKRQSIISQLYPEGSTIMEPK